MVAPQLSHFYPDLTDPRTTSSLALFHQRYATNTLPNLADRAAIPLHRAQRRNQHAAGQPQLDVRARPGARIGRVG